MSPEAIGRRLETMGQLWELSVALMSSKIIGSVSAAENVSSLVETFRRAAVEKGDYATPAKRDHKLYESMRSAYIELRAVGEDGDNAIRELLHDESVHVRTWIAAALLAEGDVEAREELEEISKREGLTGSHAGTTLEEFEKGRLNTPFPPRA